MCAASGADLLRDCDSLVVAYFDSLWSVCFRQNLQNFFTVMRSGCVRLFFVSE